MPRPVDFTEANCIFHAPDDMPDCSSIQVWKGCDEHKQELIIEVWEFTPEEIIDLMGNGRVYLTVLGGSLPPIALSTENPFVKVSDEPENPDPRG